MKRIKKKDLLKRIESLEEAMSTLMMERFINHLNDIEIEIEAKPKKKGRKPKAKEEVNQKPKKRGRKPKKEAK